MISEAITRRTLIIIKIKKPNPEPSPEIELGKNITVIIACKTTKSKYIAGNIRDSKTTL